MSENFISFFFALIIITGFYQFCYRYLMKYQINGNLIKITLFNFEYFKIEISNIDEIMICGMSKKELFDPFLYRLKNRAWGKLVYIKLKNGLRKNIVITPDDPEDFVRKIREIIQIPTSSS